jgi:hypothetical protein
VVAAIGVSSFLVAACAPAAPPPTPVPPTPIPTDTPVPPTVTPLPPTPTPGPVTLRYHFKKGDVHEYAYRFVFKTELPDGRPADGDDEVTTRYEVVDVRKDGSATIDVTVEKAAINVLGVPQSTADLVGSGFRMQMTPEGKVTNVQGRKGPITDRPSIGADNLTRAMTYPHNALKIGDTFDIQDTFDSPATGDPLVLNGHVTYLGIATAGNSVPAAEFHETLSMPRTTLVDQAASGVQVDAQVSGELYDYVDRDTGWWVSGTADVTLQMAGQSTRNGTSIKLPFHLTLEYHAL